MSAMHLARVYQVLPDQHGVLVVFRDGSFSVAGDTTFCRVLAKRAHPLNGSSVLLPEVGEQGIVAELDGGFMVWMGGIHYQTNNQVDPDEGLDLDIHTSGVIRRTTAEGDVEFLHPSGLRVSVAQTLGGLPPPQFVGNANPPSAPIPYVEFDHPSGLNIQIAPDGSISMTMPSGSGIDFGSDGSISVSAAGDVDVSALGTATISGVPNVVITGSDNVNVVSMGDATVTASGDMTVEGLGTTIVHGYDSVEVISETAVNVAAPEVSVLADAAIALTAPAITLMGVGTLNGSPILTA